MRRVLLCCVVVCAAARPARAQTRVYVSGDLFAEMPKFSRVSMILDSFGTSDTTVPPDSITIGGGGRVGHVSLAGVERRARRRPGAHHRQHEDDDHRRAAGGGAATDAAAGDVSQTTNGYGATSVLLGYHPTVDGRIHPGLLGGLSFMHRVSSYDSPNISTATTFVVTPPSQVPALATSLTVTSSEYDTTNNVLTATVGAEAAVDVTDHLSIVPEIRVHAGGIGSILLRPGVSVRWLW